VLVLVQDFWDVELCPLKKIGRGRGGERLRRPYKHVTSGYRNTEPGKIIIVNIIRRIYHCKMQQLSKKLIPMLYTLQILLQQMSGTEFTGNNGICYNKHIT